MLLTGENRICQLPEFVCHLLLHECLINNFTYFFKNKTGAGAVGQDIET